MALKGKEAEEFFAKIAREVEQSRLDRLAATKAAKKVADAQGKEPFDLKKLEEMCNTTNSADVEAPIERRYEKFERLYYVNYPNVLTLAEFALVVTELNSW